MKPIAAAICLMALAACTSTSSSGPDLDIDQKLEVKCVSSNVRPNGCRTTHEFGLTARYDTSAGAVPSADDLREPGAGGSEF